MKNESRRIPFFVIKKKQNEKQIGLVSRRYVDVCVQRQQLLISLKKLKRKAFFSCSSLTLFQDVHRDSLISLVFTNGGDELINFYVRKTFLILQLIFILKIIKNRQRIFLSNSWELQIPEFLGSQIRLEFSFSDVSISVPDDQNCGHALWRSGHGQFWRSSRRHGRL